MKFCANGRTVERVGLSEWERAWPWLEKSLPYIQGRANQTELRGRIIKEDSQLWIVTGLIEGQDIGAILTTVNGPMMMVEMIGGVGLLVILGDFLPLIERYMATTFGCKKSMVVGRMGWSKELKRAGYCPSLVMCEKTF